MGWVAPIIFYNSVCVDTNDYVIGGRLLNSVFAAPALFNEIGFVFGNGTEFISGNVAGA